MPKKCLEEGHSRLLFGMYFEAEKGAKYLPTFYRADMFLHMLMSLFYDSFLLFSHSCGFQTPFKGKNFVSKFPADALYTKQIKGKPHWQEQS